jgi:subtilase family serine protease
MVDPSLELSYIALITAPSASQQQALDQLLAQQKDRTSPNYHKWLTAEQYADGFGLSQNDMSKITAWLKAEGFQIISIGGGRNIVIFSGTAGQAQRAFGTEIHNYEVDGEKHFANSTPVTVPAALNGIVSSVMGLHSFLPRPSHARKRVSVMGNAQPNYYDSQFLFPNFLAPDDIATIYDIASLYTASNPIDGYQEKLAIVGQTDVYLADLVDFRNGFNLPAITPSNCTLNGSLVVEACSDPYFQYVVPTGTPDPGTVYSCGDLSEADLDLEWSGATARKAQIVYVNSPVVYDSECNITGGGGVFAALIAAINPPAGPPAAPVVSMSYGECEAFNTVDLTTQLQQGNAEGVTVVNSAGDSGSAGCDNIPPNNAVNPPFSAAVYGLAVNYPASSPDVTGVGGTGISLADDSYPTLNTTYWNTTLGPNGGTAKMYIPEIAWNDNEEWASFCQSNPAPPANDFCTQGGQTAVPGWVKLTTAATAAQVQSDIWIFQGGGGASNCAYGDPNTGECLGPGAGPSGGGFAQPLYQQGLSVTGAPTGVRYVPDVSLLASPNFPGYIFCTAESEFVQGDGSASTCANGIAQALNNGSYISAVGGTSASTPIFAGIVTLLNEYLVGPDSAGLSNINTQLYALAASTATSSTPAFHQDTTGDNMVYCKANAPADEPSNIVCPSSGVIGFLGSNKDTARGTGYNLVTGLGSVNAYNLALAWAASEGSATTTTVTSSQNPAIQGAMVTLTATVTTTGSNQPTGTVTFYNGTTNIGSGTLATVSGTQVATLAIDSLPVGADSITGAYGGDSNNARSTSAVLSQTITAVATTTVVASNLNPANYGAAVTFTATVTTTGSIKPTGKVTFYSGTTSLGTAALGTTGGPTVAMTALTTSAPLPVGMDSITAVYAGDLNNSGSTSAALTETVNAPTFTLSTPTTPAPVLAGIAASSTFTATPVSGSTFAGAVTFSCSFAPTDPTLTNTSCVFNTGQATSTQIAAGSGATPVTLTISTVGPNTGTGAQLRRRADNRSPWLPLTLPVAGVVMLGLMRGKLNKRASKRLAIALMCFSLALLGFMMACGGGGSSTTTPPPASVSVSPNTKQLYADEAGNMWSASATQQQFSATVSNSTSQTVTWSVAAAADGSIGASSGLYTAPATVPSPAAVTVTAKSSAATSPGTSTVTIVNPTGNGQLPAIYTVTVTATEATTVHTQPVTLVVQ